MKLNRKGFTLIEVLAVIVIIALIGGIAIPNVLNTINKSKSISEKTMISNIKTASQELYEEVEFTGEFNKEKNTIESNLDDPIRGGNIKIELSNKSITVSLQALVSNGFLNGTGEEDNQKIVNQKTGKNIGACQIKITKIVDSLTYDTTYQVEKNDTNSACPDYN